MCRLPVEHSSRDTRLCSSNPMRSCWAAVIYLIVVSVHVHHRQRCAERMISTSSTGYCGTTARNTRFAAGVTRGSQPRVLWYPQFIGHDFSFSRFPVFERRRQVLYVRAACLRSVQSCFMLAGFVLKDLQWPSASAVFRAPRTRRRTAPKRAPHLCRWERFGMLCRVNVC